MRSIPDQPKIYHITHVDNLPSILAAGCLSSDARRLQQGLGITLVGMSEIKTRRLTLPVPCHPGTMVGEYVPFYFCPRSVMLYILHRSNHPELAYRGGQASMLHLQADLGVVSAWADRQGHRWAFSNRNASTFYADFFADLRDLERVAWDAVGNSDFRDSKVKDGKQAEFLVYRSFPWQLVEHVGVFGESIAQRVRTTLTTADHRPSVRIEKSWYY